MNGLYVYPDKDNPNVVDLAVPANHLLTLRLDTPKLSANKLRQALPFLLSDYLSTPFVDNYCTLLQVAKYAVEVCCINKSKLDSWLAHYTSENLQVRRIIADYMLLPYELNCWSMVLDGRDLVIRIDQYHGLRCAQDNVSDFLQLSLRQYSAPKAIHCYFAEAEILTKIKSINSQLNIIEQPSQPLSAFNFSELPLTVNLLPVELIRKQPHDRKRYSWRLSASLGLFAISLVLMGKLLENHWLTQRNQNLQEQIENIYFSTFPQAQSLTAPQARFQSELQQLQKTNLNPVPWMNTLASINNLLHENITIQAIAYKEGRFSLSLLSDDFFAIEQFEQALQKQKFAVERDGIQRNGDKVNAILRVNVYE